MVMKNKRGWLRIVEAVLAILMLAGVLLVFYDSGQSLDNSESYISDLAINLLSDVSVNESLRQSVLDENLTAIENVVDEGLPSYLNFSVVVCNLSGSAGSEGYAVFDGSGDYVKVLGSPTANAETTISFWANSNEDYNDRSFYFFDTTNPRFLFYTTTSNFAIYVGGTYTLNVNPSTFFEPDVWGFHTISFNDNTNETKYYFNGELKGESSTGFNAGSPTTLYIGSRYVATSNFNGSLDDIMIFNRTLSTEEIVTLYILLKFYNYRQYNP